MDINQETVNDLAKRLMGRMIARKLASDPGMVDSAKAHFGSLDAREDDLPPIREWKRVLRLGPDEARRALTARGEMADWMRLMSPFSFVHGVEALADIPTRRRIWRAAKRVAITKARREVEDAAKLTLMIPE